MSNGERVKVSLDICATLAEHYGKNMPILVDNAESVTDMQETKYPENSSDCISSR